MISPSPLPASSYIDAHVHLRGSQALQDIERAGICAVRDAGGRDGAGLQLQGIQHGTKVISAGRALVKAGGYGSFLGRPVAGPEEIRSEIADIAEAGAGIIKVVASGIIDLRHPDQVTAGGFGREELRFIVRTASQFGLSVMCHANGAERIRDAAEAGVRSIEHGFFMTVEALAVLKERGIYWVPTIGALARAAESGELGEAGKMAVGRTIDRHLAMVRQAFVAAVPLAVGTDCVLPDRRYQGCYEDELAWFRRAGIPHDAVERIAAEEGARLLGLEEKQASGPNPLR